MSNGIFASTNIYEKYLSMDEVAGCALRGDDTDEVGFAAGGVVISDRTRQAV
jgi:hypothetical protein